MNAQTWLNCTHLVRSNGHARYSSVSCSPRPRLDQSVTQKDGSERIASHHAGDRERAPMESKEPGANCNCGLNMLLLTPPHSRMPSGALKDVPSDHNQDVLPSVP